MKENSTVNIGQKIRDLRREHNLTQQEFAKELHMHTSTIKNYEMSRSIPNKLTQMKIERYFGLDEGTLSMPSPISLLISNEALSNSFSKYEATREYTTNTEAIVYSNGIISGFIDLIIADALCDKNFSYKDDSLKDFLEYVHSYFRANDAGKKELLKRSKQLVRLTEYHDFYKK